VHRAGKILDMLRLAVKSVRSP